MLVPEEEEGCWGMSRRDELEGWRCLGMGVVLRIVVARCACEVSALGGGGRPASSNRSAEGVEVPFSLAGKSRSEGRMLARQRKHSPVPE